MKYLELKHLITPSQHGFVLKKEGITNLLEMLDEITEALGKGFAVDLVLLDFAKAVDFDP